MSNKHENLTSLFADIADAIREKTGISTPIVADEFPEMIKAIATSEDLTAEIQEQNNLILQIQTALENKTGGSIEGMINAPEMCTVTLNFSCSMWALFTEAEIVCNYLAIDETNTLKTMTETFSTGTSGTIQCVKGGMIEFESCMIYVESDFGVYDEFYPSLQADFAFFVGGGGNAPDTIAILINNDSNIEITAG